VGWRVESGGVAGRMASRGEKRYGISKEEAWW